MNPGPAATEPLLLCAARGYRATLVTQAIRLLCKAAAVVVVARLVTPADHGRFAMAASVFLMLVLFRDAGLGPAAVQARALSDEQRSTLARAHAWLGAALGVATIALAPVVAWFYREPQVVGLLSTMAFTFVLLGFNSWPRVLLTRELRFTELNRIETVAAVGATLAMIVAAAGGAGPYAFVVFLIVTELVTLVLVQRVSRWRPRVAARWESLSGLWRPGFDVTGHQLLTAVGQQLDSLLMGRWFGAAPLGFYNRPNQLLALANQHVCGPLVQVLMATLSRIGPSGPDFVPHVRQTANLIGYVTLPLAGLCAALPHESVRLVLGAAWPDAAPLLRWLAASWAAVYLGSIVYALGVAARQTRRLALISAVDVGALLAGLWAGRSHGPTGLAAGVALAHLGLLVPRLWWISRGTPLRLRDFAVAYAGPVLLATTLGAGARLGARLTATGTWTSQLTLGLGGSVFFGGIVLLAAPFVRRELVARWRELSGRGLHETTAAAAHHRT